MSDFYQLAGDGIHYPVVPVRHRDEEYPVDGFETLWSMQERHFWYRGRHRFLLHAVDRHCTTWGTSLGAVDLGGGVGGWVRYLHDRRAGRFSQLALADSSLEALTQARAALPPGVARYHVDLMNLGWRAQWDVAFMLDVIEHLPNDSEALHQAKAALKPGGLLFVTTPALNEFWSYNDELAHHLRRYTRADFSAMATQIGLQLVDCRYFMFFLSPLYLLSRVRPGLQKLSLEEKRRIADQQHRVPQALINTMLTATFAAETPLGHWLRFPWGTSVMGVFRKPTSIDSFA